MANITVRKLPDSVHDALKARASSGQRSVEGEVRIILEQAVFPKDRVLLGNTLQSIGKSLGLSKAGFKAVRKSLDSWSDQNSSQ